VSRGSPEKLAELELFPRLLVIAVPPDAGVRITSISVISPVYRGTYIDPLGFVHETFTVWPEALDVTPVIDGTSDIGTKTDCPVDSTLLSVPRAYTTTL
jgi:hypothetical protein